jgi:hypothetical protein
LPPKKGAGCTTEFVPLFERQEIAEEVGQLPPSEEQANRDEQVAHQARAL